MLDYQFPFARLLDISNVVRGDDSLDGLAGFVNGWNDGCSHWWSLLLRMRLASEVLPDEALWVAV